MMVFVTPSSGDIAHKPHAPLTTRHMGYQLQRQSKLTYPLSETQVQEIQELFFLIQDVKEVKEWNHEAYPISGSFTDSAGYPVRKRSQTLTDRVMAF